MKPTIVVIAYNRPHALHRLLASLRQAEYPPDVKLIISIDAGGEHGRSVHTIAQQFEWPAGEKQVIVRERPFGLTDHVFACGDLTQDIGPIILLEDDLFVSPMFYHYAAQTLADYANDSRVAGISLNALWFNGITHYPFVPILDDADVLFMQVAWYQGQAYTPNMWRRFMDWRETAVFSVRENRRGRRYTKIVPHARQIFPPRRDPAGEDGRQCVFMVNGFLTIVVRTWRKAAEAW